MLRVIGKIDLPSVEPKPAPLESLKNCIKNISLAINLNLEQTYNINGCLDEDGRISMAGFSKEKNGIYSEYEIQKDLGNVKEKEISFAKEALKDVASWQESQEKGKSSKVELLIMILLYRLLKDRFIVTRSAKYDDYKNGVDIMIVDPRSGQTICAFDGVAENDSSLAQYLEDKKKITRKIARDGGVQIQYGLRSYSNNNLARSFLSYMPIFFLSLNDKEYKNLLLRADRSIDAPITQDEISIFTRLVNSLKEQRDDLLTNANLTEEGQVKQKIVDFEKTLKVFREIESTLKEIHGSVQMNQGIKRAA